MEVRCLRPGRQQCKWEVTSDPGYTLNVEPTEFANRLDVEHKGK